MTAPTTDARLPREEFPILDHGHYANHAAMAPWPLRTARAVQAFARENADVAAERYAVWLKRETQLREMLAAMINAPSSGDIALLKNTTEGICAVSGGLEWRTGDNVVIPKDEFPSNRLPWLALERRGVEVREVDIRATKQPEQALLSRMDEKTRLLAVSAVQWTDGLRLDLEVLGGACRSGGVLFFVDAIQQLGALQVDVQACNIDFLAADGHKWLLSPEGIAVFFCAGRMRDQLRLQQLGWHMVDEPYRFDRDEWQPSATALRFEAGSPNTLGQAAMHASLELLLEVGKAEVESLVLENTGVLAHALESIHGIELARPYEPARASAIVSFKVKGQDTDTVHQALKRARVVCAVRDEAIRLSPHFYQQGDPLQRIMAAVEGAIKPLK
jgi:selenocysteine lyase/cysteine desulfurase